MKRGSKPIDEAISGVQYSESHHLEIMYRCKNIGTHPREKHDPIIQKDLVYSLRPSRQAQAHCDGRQSKEHPEGDIDCSLQIHHVGDESKTVT